MFIAAYDILQLTKPRQGCGKDLKLLMESIEEEHTLLYFLGVFCFLADSQAKRTFVWLRLGHAIVLSSLFVIWDGGRENWWRRGLQEERDKG